MSSDDNKAAAKRLLACWNTSDFETVEGMVAPDFVNHNPPPIPGIGADRDGMLAAMRYLRQAFPAGRAEAINVIAEDDKVVLHDVIRGTHEGEFGEVPPTGRDVEFEFVHIFRFRDGRIVERWGVVDLLGLMRQLGAVPSQEPAPA